MNPLITIHLMIERILRGRMAEALNTFISKVNLYTMKVTRTHAHMGAYTQS